MTALPERLRPWAEALALLQEELALALAPAVARLAELFSPPRPSQSAEHGEPRGYDGLTRRGPPERLLMSEWLLALELPDEFVRRAALGEQAYLRPAFHQPRPEQHCVVLLDAGPEQLGAPRVAHLALLVVLARRAEAAGLTFAWGVLQEPPPEELVTRVDGPSVGPWLRRAHAQPPTAEQLAAWNERLARTPGERWLVGGPRLARLPGAEGLSRVEVDEVLEPGARRLAVEVGLAAGGTRRGELELPAEAHCVRLLRDPFRAPPRPTQSPELGEVRTLRFSANGLRLLVGHEDGGVSALTIAHSPRATVPRPKRFVPRPGARVVAWGWRYRGGQLVLTWRDHLLHLHGSLAGLDSGTLAWTLGPGGPRLPEAGQSPLLAWSRTDREGHETPLLWDGQGDLYALSWNKPLKGRPGVEPSPPTRLAENVLALQEYSSGCFVVDQGPDARASQTLRVGELGVAHRMLPVRGLVLAVHIGPGELQTEAKEGTRQFFMGPALAVGEEAGTWWLLRDGLCASEDEGVRLPAPPGRVVGLGWGPGESPRDSRQLALVVLGEDRQTFWWWTPQGAQPLTKAPGRVLFARIGSPLPVLAWLTEQGELGVWSFRFEALVFRSLPEARP